MSHSIALSTRWRIRKNVAGHLPDLHERIEECRHDEGLPTFALHVFDLVAKSALGAERCLRKLARVRLLRELLAQGWCARHIEQGRICRGEDRSRLAVALNKRMKNCHVQRISASSSRILSKSAPPPAFPPVMLGGVASSADVLELLFWGPEVLAEGAGMEVPNEEEGIGAAWDTEAIEEEGAIAALLNDWKAEDWLSCINVCCVTSTMLEVPSLLVAGGEREAIGSQVIDEALGIFWGLILAQEDARTIADVLDADDELHARARVAVSHRGTRDADAFLLRLALLLVASFPSYCLSALSSTMGGLAPSLRDAIAASAEYELVSSHLSALLLSYPPSFIFVHDPENARLTASVIRANLETLAPQNESSVNVTYACINGVACFSPRILFDTALNALARRTPDWEDGALNWSPQADGRRYNDNVDAFVHGIQAIFAERVGASTRMHAAGKGKEKAASASQPTTRMVLVIERAERLKDNVPDLLVPLTRLAELPCVATLDILAAAFSPSAARDASGSADPDAYHPALKPLYAHFLATLYSTCGPFTHDPTELSYIAAARWPGFVQPVLDAHHRRSNSACTDGDDPMNGIDEDGDEYGTNELGPPSEDVRLRLTRLFTPSFTAALEALYPRINHASQWARTHAPPTDLLSVPPAHAAQALQAHTAAAQTSTSAGLEALPRMAKFILVAAFLASTNPARSDLRMFGRGPDERARRRRRKVGTPRKPKPGTTGTAVKIPQRLLGPTTFPLDRLIAILGVLLEENDAETRPVAPQYSLPGEYTEMEISRVALYAQVMELASMRLLVRTSPADRLDGTPTFKCGIGYELAGKLARELGIILNDLMFEPL
ncbi:hypothetical protein ACG7TL_001525 [Trametes sanguinea]